MFESGRQMYSFNNTESTAIDEEIYDGDLPTVKNSLAPAAEEKDMPPAKAAEVKEASVAEKKTADNPQKKEVTSRSNNSTRTPRTKSADRVKSNHTTEQAPVAVERRSVGRPKKEGPPIGRKQVPFYFDPEDHENFRILCFRLKQSMTDFGVALVADAMDNSFRCRSAACGCEFVVRTPSETKPKCPICGNEKLDRMYQW